MGCRRPRVDSPAVPLRSWLWRLPSNLLSRVSLASPMSSRSCFLTIAPVSAPLSAAMFRLRRRVGIRQLNVKMRFLGTRCWQAAAEKARLAKFRATGIRIGLVSCPAKLQASSCACDASSVRGLGPSSLITGPSPTIGASDQYWPLWWVAIKSPRESSAWVRRRVESFCRPQVFAVGRVLAALCRSAGLGLLSRPRRVRSRFSCALGAGFTEDGVSGKARAALLTSGARCSTA